MFIKEIRSFDEVSKEAEILVSDGDNEILCYAWNYSSDDKRRFSLSAFSVKDVERFDVAVCYAIPSGDGYFSYEICGKLLERSFVAVGNILIEIDLNCIPKDIKVNEYIKFHCLRVDFEEESI